MNLPFKFLKCDCVRINDAEHNMLSRFFYQSYKGDPLPISFENMLIEADRNGVVFSIACTHEREVIHLDCYVANVCVCNIKFSNKGATKGSNAYCSVKSNVQADGETFAELVKQLKGDVKAANDEFKGLSIFCVDVVREVLFAYGLVPECFSSYVEEVKFQKPNEKKKNKKCKRPPKHIVHVLVHEKMKELETKAGKKPVVYKTLTWKRKAYTCVRNGKEVHYKECICTRRVTV